MAVWLVVVWLTDSSEKSYRIRNQIRQAVSSSSNDAAMDSVKMPRFSSDDHKWSVLRHDRRPEQSLTKARLYYSREQSFDALLDDLRGQRLIPLNAKDCAKLNNNPKLIPNEWKGAEMKGLDILFPGTIFLLEATPDPTRSAIKPYHSNMVRALYWNIGEGKSRWLSPTLDWVEYEIYTTDLPDSYAVAVIAD
jgi:hypothetical protein